MGHYELLEEVGRGGMGVVYKALDTSLGRHVALKVLRKDNSENEELMKQLETEAAITASINHPHVVRVFSTGTFEGRFYIAMELVDKGTLDDLIELQGTVAEAQVLDVAIQISQGLRAAYQHGLIHRDVKPGNILFSDSKTAKIVDFGLATIEQAAVSTGEIWGTPYYVAPEKLDQKPEDFRSDMYSLGATLFHALAGRPPFEAADATLVALKHLKSEAVSLQAFAPHVSGSTAYVINRTLSKDPDKRYQSYDEFIEHLEYARREFAENATKPKVKQRLAMENEKDQRLWGLITFGMLGLLVAAGVGAFWFMQKKGNQGTRNAVEVAVPTPGAAPRTAEGRAFEAARSALMADQLDDAVKRFRAVATDPKTPEPLAHWAYVHEGLAHLLAGRVKEAQAAFDALQDLAAPKDEGAKYAKFFSILADKASSPEIVPAVTARDFPSSDATPLASLILGLKDWELGAFDQATPLIRGYHSAPAGKELPWIADYKPLISPYVADLAEFRGAMEMARVAKTIEDRRAALDGATNARQGLSEKSKNGKMAETLDALIADLKSKTPSAPDLASLSKEEQQANFDRSLAKLHELVDKWQFVEARNDIRAMQVHDLDLIKKRDLLTLKARWLEEAKEVIVAEFAAGADGAALSRKDGRPIGKITGASGEGLQTTDGLIPWPEIAHEGPIALLAAPKGGKTDIDRLWGAGVLASWAGSNEIAIKHLVAAARGQRRYLDALPTVWPGLRVEKENLALKKAVRANDVTKLEEAAEKAVDGSATTSWTANKAGAKFLQVDLGTPRIVNRWVVKHARSTGALVEANATSFSLEASVDGKAWAEVDSVKQNVSDITHRTILPTKARFFRLNVQEPVVIRIAELELYGGSVDATAQKT
ncbi:MAG: protein kinase domain-containing protein, partial [Chthoniobacteraceae bacterium]